MKEGMAAVLCLPLRSHCETMLLALVKFGAALVEPNTRNYDFAKLNGRIGENVHIIAVLEKIKK